MRIIIVPKNEEEMHLWEEKGDNLFSECESELKEIDPTLKLKISESCLGLGASWPSIVIDILEIGGIIFWAPQIHKKIRENLTEWMKIKGYIDKLFSILSKSKKIKNYSIEIAYLKTLEHLSKKTEIMNLEILESQEILGKSGSQVSCFENAEVVYYFFKFREEDDKLFSLILDGQLNLHSDIELNLDSRIKLNEESKTTVQKTNVNGILK